MTDDERPKVSTVAELFAYVSAAWDNRRQELLRHADVVRHRAARCI